MKLRDVTKALDDLKSIDLNDEHAYEKTIWKYLTCVKIPSYAYTIPKGTIVFRTRTHFKGELFHHISQIGITPRKFVSNFGRCNRPQQSVFYASENRTTSYAELVGNWANGAKDGDVIYVTIGAWELKKDLDVVIVTSPDETRRLSKYDKEHGLYFDRILKQYDAEQRIAISRLYEYLFEIFRKSLNGNNYKYIPTAAFSNISLMHPEANTNGICYPSVPFLYEGINFAIKESYALEYLELKYAMRNTFKIQLKPDGNPNFIEVDMINAKRIILDKDIIIW